MGEFLDDLDQLATGLLLLALFIIFLPFIILGYCIYVMYERGKALFKAVGEIRRVKTPWPLLMTFWHKVRWNPLPDLSIRYYIISILGFVGALLMLLNVTTYSFVWCIALFIMFVCLPLVTVLSINIITILMYISMLILVIILIFALIMSLIMHFIQHPW